ncbi:hypothetical protein H7347_07260 [Corynebacterium sp. zg-331]|uniref:P22 phage major capsid protein family protein n=1 Tax=unclassified Corynebacterium TaxID=2624378 RepID=UPI00128BF085|nr:MULTISPECIES: P22 phage major capsid protein family protein [unclassified Corynebacterium]MBC3186371.1 hypothetical protein [Corynebacterium sp. zg-331]MPV52858.1 hypothetical protein [Corynebacterium sp. zg331]
MAAPQHLLYTPEQAARSMLAALKYQSTLARMVNTDYSSEFTPGRGASVTVKRPVMIDKAKVYTQDNRKNQDKIEYSELYQPHTSVTLTDQVYNAVQLPDDFVTFTLTDLESQVVAPMAESVAAQINAAVVAAFQSVPAGLTAVDKSTKPYVGVDGKSYDTINALREAGTEFAGFGAAASISVKPNQLKATYREDVLPAIRSAHQLLSQRGVPLTGRVLVVGANWEAALLDHPQLQKVNEAGDSGLLRQATLGNLYGFTVIADYTVGVNEAWAFQRDAITLATRTTMAPRGVAFAARTAAQGFSLRYLQDYDPDILTDRAVVDTFAGAQVLDAQRIVKLTGADTMIEAKPDTPETAGGSTN